MTDFLYVAPSFVDGLASVINITGSLPAYNISSTPQEADRRAYCADVLAMYADMDAALSQVETQCAIK